MRIPAGMKVLKEQTFTDIAWERLTSRMEIEFAKAAKTLTAWDEVGHKARYDEAPKDVPVYQTDLFGEALLPLPMAEASRWLFGTAKILPGGE